MKTPSLPAALGIVLLLGMSLFSYTRSATFEHGSTQWNVDGAGLATMILCIALFVICRRIRGTIRTALTRAGLSPEVRIPNVYRTIIITAVPFFLIGYSTTSTADGITKSFNFGGSPLKLAAFVLLVLVVWLVALARRLGDLSEYLSVNATKAAGPGSRR